MTRVGLVQINNSFSGQNYFPYSVGLLQAQAQHALEKPEDFDFLLPIYSRVKIEEGVERLLEADVVLFSLYVWNVRLSLEIAKQLKGRKPQVRIICGGPQVPDKGDVFLRNYPFVDLACHGQGEPIIAPVLEHSAAKDWGDIPAISFIDEEGKFHQNEKLPRSKDDLLMPSPYLDGTFEELIAANPQERWLVLWETNRGCPFSCTFCDWGSATQSKVFQFDIERLCREVDWFAEHSIEFIFCCDANYGILKRDVDITSYVIETKQRTTYPHALSVQNTKNAKDRAYVVQKMLSDAGLNKGVTLSMQSVDELTLENIKRSNISLDAYRELQHRFTSDKVETYNDLILGLPGETYDSFVDGISSVIENGQHNRIQFNNLSILPNAEMGDPEYQREHGMKYVVSDIINIHGSLVHEDEISEKQQLVIATGSMPELDWVKTRAMCWMTAFLYFDKVLQIPISVLHETAGLSYRELLQAFCSDEVDDLPILNEIKTFFTDKAMDIQQGGAEFCQSKEWLNIWWPADEMILINLCTEDKLGAFYEEAKDLLQRLLARHMLDVPQQLLYESITLNQNLVKLPFQTEDKTVDLSFNIWESYQHSLVGDASPIEELECSHHVDRTSESWENWEDWCQNVVWYGNKKGAYLYPIISSSGQDARPSEVAIAGHY